MRREIQIVLEDRNNILFSFCGLFWVQVKECGGLAHEEATKVSQDQVRVGVDVGGLLLLAVVMMTSGRWGRPIATVTA